MSGKQVRVIELAGTPFEIGLAHGTQCRDLIDKSIETNLGTILASSRRKARVNLEVEDVQRIVEGWLHYGERYAPELCEEMRGIAEGSGHTYQEIFALNAFLDLHDLTYPGAAQRLLFGCTTFACTGRATVDGHTLVGQTYDISEVFEPQVVVLRIRPTHGPEVIVLTMAGVLAWNGLNSAGLGVVINRLTPNDGRQGLPYPLVVRKALAQENVSLALDAMLSTWRSSGIHYLLAHREGSIIGVESSATDYDYLLPTDDVLWHTNHYVSPAMRPYSTFHRPFAGESIGRYVRAGNILRQNAGSLSVETLQQMTQDHGNAPFGICRHPVEGADIMRRANTAAAMVADLDSGLVTVARGNPCANPYTVIQEKV